MKNSSMIYFLAGVRNDCKELFSIGAVVPRLCECKYFVLCEYSLTFIFFLFKICMGIIKLYEYLYYLFSLFFWYLLLFVYVSTENIYSNNILHDIIYYMI